MRRPARPAALSLTLPLALVASLALSATAAPDPVPDDGIALSQAPVGAATATDPALKAAVVVGEAAGARGWSSASADLAGREDVLERGLPAEVLAAYTTAVLAAPSGCQLSVPLLAALGQVETGNLVGHQLDASHRVVPEIIGPALDGTSSQAVADTDGGAWDGDDTWDRGVGPFRFVPSVWRVAAVDLDRDGSRDPQNVYDAAGAAMVHLCAADRDLAIASDRRAAVLSFNHSPDYVRLVLDWADAFEQTDAPMATTPLAYDAWAMSAATALLTQTGTTRPAAAVRHRESGTAASQVRAATAARTGSGLRPDRGDASGTRPVADGPGKGSLSDGATPAAGGARPATAAQPEAGGNPVAGTRPEPASPSRPVDGPADRPGTEPAAGDQTAPAAPAPGPSGLPTCPLPDGVLVPVPAVGAGAPPAEPAADGEACVLVLDPATGMPHVDPATGLPQTWPTAVPPAAD